MKSVECIIINCSLEKKNNIQIRNSTAEFLIFQLEVVCRKFRRTTQTKKSSAQLSARENFFLKIPQAGSD